MNLLARLFKRETAAERLDRIVRETRESYACEQYRRRRAAALKARRKARA